MRKLLRALIVDDEAPARELLRALLAHHRNIDVIGEADNAMAAASLYIDLRPDIIFLDIQMPDGDGFSLLPKLRPIPAVIFVTAYDEFAVRAFEVNAVDYLLKPIRAERLADALERIEHLPNLAQAGPYSHDDQFFLRSDAEMRLVFVTQISGIEAEGNYTRVHLADGSSAFLRRGITEWLRLLPAPYFQRVDRSLILNLRSVRRVISQTDHDAVEVDGFGSPIILSRRASSRLRRTLRELKAV